MLEKRKDYSLRAKDHNQKKRKLNALKAKAADRNEAALSGSMRPRGICGNRVFIAERGWDALETAVSGNR